MPFRFEREHERQYGRFSLRRPNPADRASQSRHSNPSTTSPTRDNDSSWFITEVESDECETHQEEHFSWVLSARCSQERFSFDSLTEDLPDSSSCTCLICSPIRRPNSGNHIRGDECIQNPQAHDRDPHGGSRRRCRHEDPRRTMNPLPSDFSDNDNPDITTTTDDEIPDSDDAMLNLDNATTSPSRNTPGENTHRRNDNYLSFVDGILQREFADEALVAEYMVRHRRQRGQPRRGRQMDQSPSGNGDGNSRARDGSSESMKRLYQYRE
ncbi:hypothetical protein, variant [Blastomyces dermatitidis ATCC 26199]|nr:hypothetical protein BDFG_03176 [Blastomyces dermatitidis ATCC 26199]EQL35197.1 hypothetical protein, variant [Blastomyces dermatitidis ATCC 26199]